MARIRLPGKDRLKTTLMVLDFDGILTLFIVGLDNISKGLF